MTEILNIIQNVGFPIFVAVWLLVKYTKEQDETRQALNELTEIIKSLKEELK